MNSYSKFMLAASLSVTTGATLAAEVESYFNNPGVFKQYNSAISAKSAHIDSVKLKPSQVATQIAQHFATKASGDLNLVKVTSKTGQQFLRYQQSYQGLDIWDHQVVLMLNGQGEIKQGYGALVKSIEQDLPTLVKTTKLDEKQQLELFIKNQFADQQRIFNHKSTETVVYLDANNIAHQAYKLSFFTDVTEGNSQPQKILAFVDVNSGQILEQKDVLHRATKAGGGPSGNANAIRADFSESGSINTSSDAPIETFIVNRTAYNKKCYFDRENVATRDWGGDTTPVNDAVTYTCDGNNIHDEDDVNTAKSALNDAHYNGQLTNQMFARYLGQEPFRSHKIKQNVHYGVAMDQAFYNDGMVSYGDGDYVFYPMVALDVVAHEIAHGFTEEYGSSSKKFMSSGQAGAINESFSDIAGAAAEYFLAGESHAETDMTSYWRSNSESFQLGDALRYFDTPTLDGVSIDHTDDYETSTPIHYAAGIFNKAFYNLVTNPVATGETSPWNVKYGFVLFSAANQNCWISTSTFAQAADCVMNNADVIDNALGADGVRKSDNGVWTTAELKNHIRKAFAQVGISMQIGAGLESDFSHSGKFLDVDFISGSRLDGATIAAGDTDWSWAWDFGDGEHSTQASPSYTYAAEGTYPVSLTMTHTSGQTDTMTMDVDVYADYCVAGGNNFDQYFIDSVSIRNTPNDSGSSSYTDFSATPVTVVNGMPFDIVISDGYHANSANMSKNYYVWIDENNDGKFDKEAELFYEGYGKGDMTATVAVNGQTDTVLRVRTMVSFSIIDNPCGAISFGEVEDYSVKIGDNNTPPNLSYTVDTNTKNEVTVTNTTNDARVENWYWTFIKDDGSVNKNSVAESPTFTFPTDGIYNVVMSARDANQVEMNQESFSVNLTTSIEPVIQTTPNLLTVLFDATASKYPEGSTAAWTLGDNETLDVFGPVNYSYAQAGTYNVTLTITDVSGTKSQSVSENITVDAGNNYTPVLSGYNANNLVVTFNNDSAIPADLNSMMTSATLNWDFGDGNSDIVANTTFADDYTHTYAAAGTYTASLSVTYTNDNDQVVTSAAVDLEVTVTEAPPAAQYCDATGDTAYEYIASVSFNGGADLYSANDDGGVASVVNQGSPVALNAGASNSFIITAGYRYDPPYALNYHIWVDLNGDGVWAADFSERFVATYDGANGTFAGNIDLPAGSEIANTRMRIIQLWLSNGELEDHNTLGACPDYTAFGDGGEIEDYEVTIN